MIHVLKDDSRIFRYRWRLGNCPTKNGGWQCTVTHAPCGEKAVMHQEATCHGVCVDHLVLIPKAALQFLWSVECDTTDTETENTTK